MSSNDVTGDKIINTKGDNKKYADGWDKIFGKNKDEMKEHVQQITGDTPHDVVGEGFDTLERIKDISKKMDKWNVYVDCEEQYKILDVLTRLEQEMGLYDE